MRKYTRIGTLLLALVMCLTMLTAQAESELPEEVADLFTVKAWAHYAIANQPDMPENKAFAVMQEESGYEAALLVMRNTKSETNVLVLAEKSSAQADWKITMRNWGAVTQTCRSWRCWRTGVSSSTTRTATARISRMKRIAGS